MEEIYNWGINLILFLQSLGHWIIPPMKFFTTLGIEEFYLLVVPILYWCIDPLIGVRTGIMLILSGGVNNILKWAFHQPRPYWVSTGVTAYYSETSFGLPSGHAQNAVAIWGIIAHSLKKSWAWIVAVFLMFFIGISRLVLGVHFPQDTLLGWAVGLFVLLLFIKIEPSLTRWLSTKKLGYKVALYALLSLALILVGALSLSPLRGWTMPSAWAANIQTAFPKDELPNPATISAQVTLAGVFFGLTLGYTLLFNGSGFAVKGKWWHFALRYLVGIVGVLVIWAGLDQLFPEGETFIAIIFRYIRYFLVGLWMSWLAPLLFIRLRIASPLKHNAGVHPK